MKEEEGERRRDEVEGRLKQNSPLLHLAGFIFHRLPIGLNCS
jgi:hypothetical protein